MDKGLKIRLLLAVVRETDAATTAESKRAKLLALKTEKKVPVKERQQPLKRLSPPAKE